LFRWERERSKRNERVLRRDLNVILGDRWTKILLKKRKETKWWDDIGNWVRVVKKEESPDTMHLIRTLISEKSNQEPKDSVNETNNHGAISVSQCLWTRKKKKKVGDWDVHGKTLELL